MQNSTCISCRLITRSRFRQHLVELKDGRRRLSSTRYSKGQNRLFDESWYWDTAPPTQQNLEAAHHFFKFHRPFRAWAGETWRQRDDGALPLTAVPEVIFLGRSNVGKSSLINALVHTDIARASSTPGATQTMAAWSLAAKNHSGGAVKGWDGDVMPKLTLVDMPGYGYGSRAQWGDEIVTYLQRRKNLRRAFLLVDVMHGVMGADHYMMDIFEQLTIPYQIVATKCDRVDTQSESEVRPKLTRLRTQANLDEKSLALGEIITMGHLDSLVTNKRAGDTAFGVRHLQWAILRASGLDTHAMTKAEAHGLMKQSASRAAANTIASHMLDSLKGDSLPAQPPKQSQLIDSSLSLQDFMREILKTGPTLDSVTRDSGSQSQDWETARVFDPISSNRGANHLARGTNSTPHSSTTATQPTQTTHNNSNPLNPSPRVPLTPQPPLSRKGVTQGVDAFEAMFEEAPKQPQIQQSSRSGRRRQRAGEKTSADDSGARSSQSHSQATLAGKIVTQGLDAFESMFEDSAPKKGSSKSKPHPSSASGSRSPQHSSRVPQAPASLVGKGVVSGAQAFEALFEESSSTSNNGSRRRRKR